MTLPIDTLESILKYRFNDSSLLVTALTHRSSLNENKGSVSNERLEFLGDAVLELLISDFLYKVKPDEPEGVLTANRSAIVRTESLSTVAQKLKLGDYLIMSKGEETTGGRTNTSLLANTTESIIGAIYLDGGLLHAQNFIDNHLLDHARNILETDPLKDYKGLLQEAVQKKGLPSPTYREISSVGPDHAKTFTIEVLVNNKPLGTGSGKSKQDAEQAAAQKALNLV